MSALLTPARVELGLWLAICAGLAVGIGIETGWGSRLQLPAHVEPAPGNDFSPPVLAEPFRLPAADTFLETAMRPLFIVTRRPAPAAPPPEPPKPTMRKDQFTLTGITVVPEGKFAFLIEKAGNRARVVSEGKEINGITVKEVSASQVVLSQYDDTEVLTLKTAKGPAMNAAPMAPPPQQYQQQQPHPTAVPMSGAAMPAAAQPVAHPAAPPNAPAPPPRQPPVLTAGPRQ